MRSSRSLLGVLVLALVIACAAAQQHPHHARPQVNTRPIVGVLTQPIANSLKDYGNIYIPASYIKYVEAAGARAVPVFHNSTKEQLKEMFDSVNALLLPGGDSEINGTPLYLAAEYLFDLAIDANQRGDYFPIAGHCMGFEILSQIVTQNLSVLTPSNAENISLPLHFSAEASSSRLFGDCPADVYHLYETKPVTLNNHHWAITPRTFREQLASKARVISSNYDKDGVEFISTWEMRDYPIWAIQWHSEKPLFEWKPTEDINHHEDAIRCMQFIDRKLGVEARKNAHHFKSAEAEQNALIYNWCPIFSYKLTGDDFDQAYVWQ